VKKTKQQAKAELREPAFLLWLTQFVGEWSIKGKGEKNIEVGQRDDGFLGVRFYSQGRKVPLASVFKFGKFVKGPEGPLGPRPVVLSGPLMNLWLTQEQVSSLQGAWNVSRGMTRIMETIEKRITEMPKQERDRRWLAKWRHYADDATPLSSSDFTTHLMLLRRYKTETKAKA
jgi:hypothetical protein